MKDGSTVTKLIMLFLAACLAAYFGVHVWQGMTTSLVTAVAYTYQINDSVEADGLLVRQEQVLPGSSGIADVSPGEGERVGKGQTIAVIYRDSRALERKAQIQALTLEAELLEDAMSQTVTDTGTAALEENIVRAAVTLRANVSAGDFGRLEDQIVDLKRAVLRRDYTYGNSSDGGRLAQINSELRALQSQSAQDTSSVKADRAGTYSAQVDGFESVIDLGQAQILTAARLDELMSQKIVLDDSALGKLITSNRWGLVTKLPAERAKDLVLGHELAVRFTGDFDKDVPMRIDRVGENEQGECVVLLTTDRYLSSTTLLRRQTVEIIFEQDEGLRVPKEAVHILTETATDEQGNATQTSRTGVYAVVNNRAEFKNVQVLAQGGQFYVVRPLDEGKLALRAGDQIIIRGKTIHHGSIVME